RHRRLASDLRDGVESIHARHEQIDHHHVESRRVKSVYAGMRAQRWHRFALPSGHDGPNCAADAGIVIDDENSRRRFGGTEDYSTFVRVQRSHRATSCWKAVRRATQQYCIATRVDLASGAIK